MSRRTLLVLTVLAITASTAWAQENAPAFEVASIRLVNSNFMTNMVRTLFEGSRYTAQNATLRLLIRDAYGVDDNQVAGIPPWGNSEKYDIEAAFNADRLSNLSEQQRKNAHQHMLQVMLTDRFKLTLHHEVKELPVYLLTITKSGSKMRAANPDDTYANGVKTLSGQPIGPHMGRIALGGGAISGQGLPIAALVRGLSGQLGRLVVDKTGLGGNYDFKLEWTPEHPVPEFNKMDGPSLFTALEEQLGLKLEASKAPIDILVIDSAEHPTEN